MLFASNMRWYHGKLIVLYIFLICRGLFIFQDEVKDMMTKEEFIKQKEQRKTFLVIAEEEGDSITPISLYRRMKGKKRFLLESSQLHQDKGRYSYLGCNPYGEVKSIGTEVERTIYGQTEELQGNVLQLLEEVIASTQVDSPLPFCGGAVGYIGYDVIRQYENIGVDLHDPLNIPEVHLYYIVSLSYMTTYAKNYHLYMYAGKMM